MGKDEVDGKYVDDWTITDGTDLWRRIHPNWKMPDVNTGSYRISSAAFDNTTGSLEMSVVISSDTRDPFTVLTNYSDHFLAAITAGAVRLNRQIVVRAAIDEEPDHANVVGIKTRPIKRKLAKAARWVIPPT